MKIKTIGILFLLLLTTAYAETEERREKEKEAIFQSARISRLQTQNNFFYEKMEKLEKQNKDYALKIQHLRKVHAEEVRRLKKDIQKAQLRAEIFDQISPFIKTLTMTSGQKEEKLPELLKNPEEYLTLLFYKASIEASSIHTWTTPVMQLTQTILHVMNQVTEDDFSLEKYFIENMASRAPFAMEKHKEGRNRDPLQLTLEHYSFSMPRILPIFEADHSLMIENVPLKLEFSEEKQSFGFVPPKITKYSIGVNTEPLDITSIGVNTSPLPLELSDTMSVTLPKKTTESFSIGTDPLEKEVISRETNTPEIEPMETKDAAIQTEKPSFENEKLWIENTPPFIKNLNIPQPLALDVSTLPGVNMISTFKQAFEKKIDDIKNYYTKEIRSKDREIKDTYHLLTDQREKLQNQMIVEINKSNDIIKKYESLKHQLAATEDSQITEQNHVVLENINLGILNQELTAKLLKIQDTLKSNEEIKQNLDESFLYTITEQDQIIKKLRAELELKEENEPLSLFTNNQPPLVTVHSSDIFLDTYDYSDTSRLRADKYRLETIVAKKEKEIDNKNDQLDNYYHLWTENNHLKRKSIELNQELYSLANELDLEKKKNNSDIMVDMTDQEDDFVKITNNLKIINQRMDEDEDNETGSFEIIHTPLSMQNTKNSDDEDIF